MAEKYNRNNYHEPWRIQVVTTLASFFGVIALVVGAIVASPFVILWFVFQELEWHWRGTLWRGDSHAERWWWRYKF